MQFVFKGQKDFISFVFSKELIDDIVSKGSLGHWNVFQTPVKLFCHVSPIKEKPLKNFLDFRESWSDLMVWTSPCKKICGVLCNV